MLRRHAIFLCLIALAARPGAAQTPLSSAEPSLRRWLEVQTLVVATRYRVIETDTGVVSANHVQYRELFRARLNADARRRYTLNVGAFSGTSFTGTWINTGIGTGDPDFHSHYIKQLFGAAIPVDGLELQVGGLYIVRGENTEYTSYDEDGYVVGERATVRWPRRIYLDEVTITHGMLGPINTPSLMKRWDGFSHPNYTQVLASKHFTQVVAGSIDYSTQSGAETMRAAVSLRFNATAPISSVRYEQYHRMNAHPAGGLAVTAERPLVKGIRLQAGYATVDERYGGLNADRIQRGRRVFAVVNAPIAGPFSASFFATHAFSAPYSIPNRTRFDAILQYDVLNSLRKTGKI